MDRLMNAMKLQSAAQQASSAQPRFAIVSSVDPKAMAARVLLQPEQVLTGWLPVLSPWVGDGWGLCAPPAPGDQVLIIPQEGEAASGAVLAMSLEQRDSSARAGRSRRALATPPNRHLYPPQQRRHRARGGRPPRGGRGSRPPRPAVAPAQPLQCPHTPRQPRRPHQRSHGAGPLGVRHGVRRPA